MLRLSACISLCVALVLSTGCGSAAYNPTTYPFKIDSERLASNTPKKLILAPVNIGPPTLSHLRRHTGKVDKLVEAYLKKHNFQLLPDYHFSNAWSTAESKYGQPYDPTNGRINSQTFRLIMNDVVKDLKANTQADAIVFTDIIEQEVQYTSGITHVTRWHGVQRKPATQGAGEGVPTSFNWSQPAKAASLVVNIYDLELKQLFQSIGGLDTTSAIALNKSPPRFMRRRHIFNVEGYLEEGIEIAFHPFIPMKKYPGKKD